MNEMCAARPNHLAEGEVEEGGKNPTDVRPVHPVNSDKHLIGALTILSPYYFSESARIYAR